MPVYVFECPGGHETDEIRAIDRRDDLKWCPECNLEMDRVPTIPVVQTINTHMAGVNGKHATDGQGYFDYNLRDRKTGIPPYITSLDQKRKLLKSKGLEEVGDDMSLPGAAKRRDDEKRERKHIQTFDAKRSTR